MNLFELVFIVIDLFWTPREQRKLSTALSKRSASMPAKS
jgi:hypothetical protein